MLKIPKLSTKAGSWLHNDKVIIERLHIDVSIIVNAIVKTVFLNANTVGKQS